METNDVLRRIVGQHWRLLTGCLLGGMLLGLLFAPHGTQYAASARLVLDTPDPVARQQAEAYADTAKAIATSPAKVNRALLKAGVRGEDPADFARTHVSVQGLGSSGVIELTVRDRNNQVAASIANALAASVIRTRLAVTNGQNQRTLAELDRQTEELTKKISSADVHLSALSLQTATATTATEAAQFQATRDATESTREFLVQQRSVLESERVSLLSATANHPEPSVISSATPPTRPEAGHRTVYLVLGALLGLILGVGAAGVIETIRPTLVGGDTLAGELNTALLGTIAPDDSTATATAIGARLRLAAEAAGVGNVAMVTAGPGGVDLGGLAEALNGSADALRANGNGHPGILRIARFDPENPPFNNGSRSGLVLVSPSALKKAELSDVENLRQASRLPLLGVITYEGEFRRGVKNQIDLLKKAVR